MPPGSGESFTVNNSIADSAGLAGLEIEVLTPYGTKHSIDASNFLGRFNQVYGSVPIDGYGKVQVLVRIRQHDALVAEGRIAWTVDSEGHDGWEVVVVRLPHTPYNIDITAPEPCGVSQFQCTTAARVEIDAAARNYPGEALWLIVRRDDWGAIWE